MRRRLRFLVLVIASFLVTAGAAEAASIFVTPGDRRVATADSRDESEHRRGVLSSFASAIQGNP